MKTTRIQNKTSANLEFLCYDNCTRLMHEGPDKNLQNEWNRRLAEEGLPETVRREKIVMPATSPMSAGEILTSLVPDIEESLERFATLPEKIQSNILIDLKQKREAGMRPRQILDRFSVLLIKGQEFDKMTAADSDETYKPNPSSEVEPDKEKEIAERVDTLFERMEAEVNRPQDPKVDEHIN